MKPLRMNKNYVSIAEPGHRALWFLALVVNVEYDGAFFETSVTGIQNGIAVDYKMDYFLDNFMEVR